MINFKKIETGKDEFVTMIPVYTVIGYFGDDEKSDTLIESELYDDTVDYFNSIYTNSCANTISKKDYSFNDLKKAELRVTLMGVKDDIQKQIPLFSTVVKELRAIYETNTTQIKIKNRFKKKSPIIKLTIAECLNQYINKDKEQQWEKYDLSDWRAGLENTDYIEV